MLNPRGGIECDFTVTRLAEERFRIVTGTAFGRHDLAWIREHAPEDGSVRVEDVTPTYACLGLWGPRARAILEATTPDDLSFGYMRAGEISVGPVPCLALRVTYDPEPWFGYEASFAHDPGHAVHALRIISAGFPFYAYAMVMTAAFNGAGDTITPTVINIFCFWLWELPIAYALAHVLHLGPSGVFWSIAIAYSTMAVVASVWFRRGRWKLKKV